MAFDRDEAPRRRALPVRLWLGFWGLLTGIRRAVFNLLFLALLGALLWAWLKPGPPPLRDKTALVLDIAGPITEQKAGNPRDSALGALQGQEPSGARLRDVVAVIDAAAADPKIPHLLLRLDNLGPAGLPTLREVGAALQRFKAAGKPIYAWGTGYDQRSLYLAAQADAVWMHPMGFPVAEGFGRQRNYYKDALDKLGVQANVISAGTYKSFGEVYSRSGPSEAATEAEKYVYDALWARWTADFEAGRKLPAGSVMALIDDLPAKLAESGGNFAQTVLAAKWVDALKTPDELRAFMIDKGAKDEEAAKAAKSGRGKPEVETFRQVSFSEYLARLKPQQKFQGKGDAVGVIVAEGEISDGQAPPGSIGGASTAALVRQARADDRIKAIVLRVDSPGGSAFGSELVRRELELTRAAGKPVLVSMGDLAASGGYWISMAADEVWADETTITGSIGVVAVLPSVKGTMDKLGINTGGYSTTWLAGLIDPRKPTDPRLLAMVNSGIGDAYRMFLDTVGKARGKPAQAIDPVAQGRIWTGAQAKERGLVDQLGGLREVVAAAAQRAKLAADSPVRYIEQEPGKLQALIEQFSSSQAGWAAPLQAALAPALRAADPLPLLLPGVPSAVIDGVRRDLGWLRGVADETAGRKPFETVVHCLCSAP